MSEKKNKGNLFIISGPSGAGKTTLVELLLDRYQDELNLYKIITYTTRTPRLDEVDGIDYHFVSKEFFVQKIEQGFFLEWNQYADQYYGTSNECVSEINKGKNFILIIDRNGMQEVVQKYPCAVTIWITVDNVEVLKERLCKRGADSDKKIEKRLKIAENEIIDEEGKNLYQYHIKNAKVKHSLELLYSMIRQYIRAEI